MERLPEPPLSSENSGYSLLRSLSLLFSRKLCLKEPTLIDIVWLDFDEEAESIFGWREGTEQKNRDEEEGENEGSVGVEK